MTDAGMTDAGMTSESVASLADGRRMRYGAVLPGGTAPEQVELAVLAEESGWDGVFVWEAADGPDARCMLTAGTQPGRHAAGQLAAASQRLHCPVPGPQE